MTTPIPSSRQPATILNMSARGKAPYPQYTVKVGDMIGCNRVMVCIGEGAMASIYKVWNEELEVFRAVKLLKKGFTDEMRDRFITEAKILADIHHPNIVEIHGLGYWNDTVPYMELEYVDGISLKKLISRSGRLPLPVALATGYFVALALHYAHTKDYTLYGKVYSGLIHRDIKPSNILILGNGLVKLMDFGIARPTDVHLHTVGEKVVGSLPYLSPEQLDGKNLDHRSDLYSLGMVLYEMIAGRRAYPQQSIADLVRAKAVARIAPLEEIGNAVPGPVIELVQRCIIPDPDRRFDSTAALMHGLFTAQSSLSGLSPQELLWYFMTTPEKISQVDPGPAQPVTRAVSPRKPRDTPEKETAMKRFAAFEEPSKSSAALIAGAITGTLAALAGLVWALWEFVLPH